MRIGIDATALPYELYGAANYIVNLIQTLLRVDVSNDYVVFTKPVHAPLFEQTERLHLVRVPSPHRIQRIAWEQVVLPALVRQHRLDVLHCPHYTMPFFASCPTVVTFHDMTFYLYPQMHLAYKRLFFRTMIPLSVRRARAIIAISNSTREDILRLLKPAAAQVFCIPYGIASFFQPVQDPTVLEIFRQRYNLPRSFILYVGNLEPRKNLPTLLRSFAQLIEAGLDHTLVLAGSRGWKDSEIFATLRSLGLSERVCFPGYIPQPELPGLYSLSDVFVYPSLYEGFGLPVLEAMACGTPVITSNVSSMPEVAGDAGILIDPGNVDALANAIRRVLTDQSLRVTLAAKGLERAQSFSWERTARETAAVYRYAVQNR